jgi:hypothetical protein
MLVSSNSETTTMQTIHLLPETWTEGRWTDLIRVRGTKRAFRARGREDLGSSIRKDGRERAKRAGCPQPNGAIQRHCSIASPGMEGKVSISRRISRLSRTVNQVWIAVLAGLAIWGSGCAAPQPWVGQERIGPIGAPTATAASSGSLIVYSAWDRFDTLDAEHQRHTPYQVLSEQGALVARVRNQAGSFGQDPSAVSLSPGRYWVEARATNAGQVRVPILIREGLNTVVYLDGVAGPTLSPAPLAQVDWVRQPNGRIVGWKASSALGAPSGD